MAYTETGPSELQDDLFDLRMSEEARPLYDQVKAFVSEVAIPHYEEYLEAGKGKQDIWSYTPGQMEALEKGKAEAKKRGLWNFFLPDAETGEGLSNLDYAYIAAELGKCPLASEMMNCAAPDTGNMEVLERVGTPEQKERWLKPLLAGEIRSAFAMTEPIIRRQERLNQRCSRWR
jgi:acyl-CoA dehydrogenase